MAMNESSNFDEPLNLGPPPPIHIPPPGPIAGTPPPSPVAFSAQPPIASPPPAVQPPAAQPPAPVPPANSAPAPKPATPPAAPSNATARYTVKSGDTLGAIAERNGTTVSEIMKANPSLKNPNQIAVGQQLNLPQKQSGGGFSSPPAQNPPAQNRPPATSPDAKPPGQTPTPQQPNPGAQPASTLIFPLWNKPSASWKDGPRYFGCPRSGGSRKHAGCDLYAPFGAKIRAIADGVIIQRPYYFYDGTNALEVYHPGVGVVRYGEISSSKTVPVSPGQKVKVGEHIAYVGLLDSLNMSMIHFELFGEQARGQNLSGGGAYRRNPALKDPTSLIDKLHKITFG